MLGKGQLVEACSPHEYRGKDTFLSKSGGWDRLNSIFADFEKLCGIDQERLRNMPECNDRDVLLTALHGAYMRSIDPHFNGESGLTHARLCAIVLEIVTKYVTDIHPPTNAYRVF